MKKQIRFLIMDVDGTLTDGKVYMGENGELFKAFDVKDGCGIRDILPQHGMIPAVITARKSMILENRCRELGIEELHQGKREKVSCMLKVLEKFCSGQKSDKALKYTAYIGDDILDVPCMELVREHGGVTGCPRDAVKEVKEMADFISYKNGGAGAVRDFIEWLIQ